MFCLAVSLYGFNFSGSGVQLGVFLVVVYLGLLFCERILRRVLASECFSFTKEQTEFRRANTKPFYEFSLDSAIRENVMAIRNLQSSL